jgi:two-component system chemotaxis response regulator CheB
VLVVDDSVVARRLLSDAINAEPACEVVGTAPNGKLALAKLPQLNPDIVTLDIEMPEMDGLQTLAEIRKFYPRLPVIMCSTLTERGAEATLRALELGATDYITKPTATNAVSATEQIREHLIPMILGFTSASGRGPSPAAGRGGLSAVKGGLPTCAELVARARFIPLSRPPKAGITARAVSVPPVTRGSRIDIVAIGLSTGGPNVLASVLPMLSADFPVPVVITQHMPPLFTRLLAERINRTAQLEVREATGGEVVERGHVYLAPGDYHMEVRRDGATLRTYLHQAPPENSCRPSVDVMFRSVVDVYGAKMLAVVLTGMGQDGLRGCELVREAGGYVVVQDEASSVVWGMPGAVANAGLADAIVGVDSVAAEISRRVSPLPRVGAARAMAAKA